MFYNPKRKHVRNGTLSHIEFEKQQKIQLEGVYETRGYSKGLGVKGGIVANTMQVVRG
ncbi:UNVERIFIED_ORG: hypothetical protein QE446_005077 [Rhizobium sp. SORGH_AS260]|nr:hypothetical protein [Agrobacterium sp. RC10-4-1]MDP9734935.1 hypothetical protein [Rhizobium sp. SORGH_AS_0285]MDP9757153.1 hypothetical protein [Rhizobium sp. SORGH_AS_0260]MDR6084108.1 hypothetical protein [Agrobacterium sp. SORGH_AS_0440]